MLTILGINSAYHESAAALLVDGRCVAAAEEERFTGIKHAKRARIDNPDELPVHSMCWCLERGGLQLDQVDAIAFSFSPGLRRANVGVDGESGAEGWGTVEGERVFEDHLLAVPRRLSELASSDLTERFFWVEHHHAHAASAFFPSPYPSAAILSIDGIGEVTTTWLGRGEGIDLIKEGAIRYPHSLGLLWEKISLFLGFDRYAAGTTMGLAAWGRPGRYRPEMERLLQVDEGRFRVEASLARLRSDSFAALEGLFGIPRRKPGDPLVREHMDVAAALQEATERVGVSLAQWLRERTGEKSLCLAGGVALNCRMNEAIARADLFESIFVQPAAHDAGTALGAALWVWHVHRREARRWTMSHAFLGPAFEPDRALGALERFRGRLRWETVRDPVEVAVERLAGGECIGWFHGQLEFGPRALGNRSILCDPRQDGAARRLNERVKRREWFRPFAGSFLTEEAGGWLDLAGEHPAYRYMTMTAAMRSGELPGVTHRDGTCRPQLVTPKGFTSLRAVLETFRDAAGVPALLNTSLNLRGRPLAGPPSAALRCLLDSELDALVIPPYLVERT